MKSAEEVLKSHVSIGRPDHAGMRNVSTECDNITDAMEEYAVRRMKLFAEWLLKNYRTTYPHPNNNRGWTWGNYYLEEKDAEYFTTEKLLEKFNNTVDTELV